MARHDTHTPAWNTFSDVFFCTAVSMVTLGIVYLPLDLWMRGYVAMAALFLVHASISLTKTLRHRHEADWPVMSVAENGR